MTPNTWEEAATKVAVEVGRTNIGGYPDPLKAIEQFIDLMHKGGVDHRAGLILVADEATTVYARAIPCSRMDALQSIVKTIAEKQADYGPQNILWAGIPGILLRMHDKVARIRNLEKRASVGNEPLADSWLDLVGYSIVGIMLLDGTFELPLMRDVQEALPGVGPVASKSYDTVADATGNNTPLYGNPFEQLAEDPEIQAAHRQFVGAAAAPQGVTPSGEDDTYNIEGGGTINVYPSPDGTHTHVTLTNGKGGVLDIMAYGGGVTIDTDGTAFQVDTQRMSVLLCMLLGAAEAGLAWRNTHMTAEVPKQ
jgi:hypothetical protein